jgi:hypothetical protein
MADAKTLVAAALTASKSKVTFPEDAELFAQLADRIEHLEAALREPDRMARILRNVAEWTPRMKGQLVAEILNRWPDTRVRL